MIKIFLALLLTTNCVLAQGIGPAPPSGSANPTGPAGGVLSGTYPNPGFAASPTFTGTVTIPIPFTLGATSVTSTGTQLNYLNAASGTTGTTSTNVVFSTSPVLVTPNLGTPSTLILTNATGTPNSIGLANGTGLPIGGITGLGSGIGTWLATPSSTNLASAVTDETGSGALVFANTPTLVTPVLGAATATSINFGGSTLSNYVSATSWTPSDASGAALSFSSISANYTRIGNMVFAYGSLAYPGTADGSNAAITGLPITIPNQGYARQCILTFSSTANASQLLASQNNNTFSITTAAGVLTTNAQMSNQTIIFICIYPVA